MGKSLVENMIGTLEGDPLALVKMTKQINKAPLALRDAYLMNKFYNFLKGGQMV